MIVYLAGNIGGLSYDNCTEWRDWAKNKLAEYGIVGLSPMRAKEMLEGNAAIDEARDRTYEHPVLTPKGITTRDRWDTTRCDLVIMNLLNEEKISAGTLIEMGWADLSRVPIILVCQEDGYYDKHPMITDICGYKVRSLKESIEIARGILLP